MTRRASRRSFLGTASIALATPALGISVLQADEGEHRKIDTGHDFESLVELILNTPRNHSARVLADQLGRGVSYQQLLAGLLHAAVRHQGAHEIAMMFSAHRIGAELSLKEGLLPLFWAFDSLAIRIASVQPAEPVVRPLALGTLPSPAKALKVLQDAMVIHDRPTAELAALSLARSLGTRQTVALVWRYACRDSDDLGHTAIVCANVWRALDTVGWEQAEIPLRYMLGSSARGTDATYDGSRQLMEATLAKLPPDWASAEADYKATLELYNEIRSARTAASAELVCEQLVAGKVHAGSVWDAIHLTAADLLYRFKTREDIRGWPVHAVTSSNALHFAFRVALDSQTRLLLLLQATSRISDQMTKLSLNAGRLRDCRIVDAEPADVPSNRAEAIEEIFELLPYKHPDHKEKDALDRASDDAAYCKTLVLLRDVENRSPFIHAACRYLVRKATWNAHDFKFPAAAFEDAGLISERWRPYFLASTVHALHGKASDDAPIFAQAREVLATL